MDSSRGAATESHEGRWEQLGRNRKGDETKATFYGELWLTTSCRPSPIEPKAALRSIGTRWEAREKSFDGRLIALQDMHYADFAEDDVSSANNLYRSDTDSGNQSAALMAAIKEYEASKWKVIGQKVGKPAKVD